MQQIDSTRFRKRFLLAFSIAMLAIPTIGAAIEIFLGVYSLDEILYAVADYTIFYIIAVYALGVYGLHRLLLYHTSKLEQALDKNNQEAAERVAKQLSQLCLYSLVYVLLYSQGGPFSVNYLIINESLRAFDTQKQILSYVTTLPTILITLFPFFLYLYELLGTYLAPKGVVINAIPIRVKIFVLGMVTPLLIDMMLILYFEDRTGYFNFETVLLWIGLFSIATAGAYLTYRSFSLSLTPLQGPLENSKKVEALSSRDIRPISLDEMGLLAKGWQNLLSKYQQYQSDLQAERNFSNAIVNNANAMVVVLDSQGRLIEFNKVCEDITRFKKSEVLGKHVWDHFIVPEEVEAVKGVFQDLTHSSFNSNYTNYWLTREGERRLIAWSNSTIQNSSGKVQNVISVGIDITDQRKVEEDLRTSQDTLAKAQAIAHIGHWDWDIITNNLTWSDEIFRIFGLAPQQFETTYPAFLEYVHPDDREAVTAAVNAAVADPQVPYSIEHRVCRPDGAIRTVQERGEIYRDKTGTAIRMVGTVHDITERKEAQAALHEFKSTLDQTLDCVFMFDAEKLKFYYANQGALDQVGYSQDELLQMTPFDIKPDFTEASFRELIQPLHQGDINSMTITTRHRHKDGHNIPVEIFLQYISSEDKPRFVAIVRDITDRIAAEDEIRALNSDLEQRVKERTIELEQANLSLQHSFDNLQKTQQQLVESEKMAALGGLVAGVAHEINNPIGIGVTAATHLSMKIREYQELYKQDALTRNDFENLLKSANDSTKILETNLQRAAEMIRSFKQVAVDQSSEQSRRFDMNDYLHEVLRSLQPRLRTGHYDVHINCPAGFSLNSYPGAISQIITNLVINSLVHGFDESGQGNIWIDVSRKNGQISMDYRDNGKGINKQSLGKIFDPFYTTKRNQGGSGLGLHILYNIVTQTLGGTVKVDSDPGHGVHFHISFPELGE